MTGTVIIGKRAAATAPGFDPQARTLSFVAVTETPCPAYREDGFNFVVVDEILVASGCQNLATVRGPLLDSHNRWSVRDVLGRLTSAKVEGSTVVGTATLSTRPDVRELDGDFADGILPSVSAGYTCLDEEWDKTTTPFTVRVTKWTLDEVSVVPIPADQKAQMRAQRAKAAIAVATTPTEASMSPEVEAALTAMAQGLTGLRSALTTSTTPPAAVVTPPVSAAPAAVTVNVSTEGTRAAPATADKDKDTTTEDTRSDDEDMDSGSDGDGDGTGGDAEERKRKRSAMIKDLKVAMGARSSEQFEALVRQGAPAAAIRKAAFGAVRSAPAKAVVLTQPANGTAATGGKRDTFIPFSERAKRAPAKVR